MATIPPGYAQVNIIYAGAAVPLGAQITFGVDATELDTPLSVATLVGAHYDAADIESVVGNGANVTGILVKFGPNATGPSVLYPFSNVSDGGAPSDSPGTSTLVHKQTALGGRSGRGRLYLPATPDAGVDLGGALTPTFRGQVQTRVDDFLTRLEGSDIPMVVLHEPGAPLSTPTVVTSLTADARVATQRRRNRR